MKQMSNVVSCFTFPIVVFLAHLVASKLFDLYTIYPNLDIPAHFLGGFSIAFSSIQLLSYWKKEGIIPTSNLIMILIFSFTITATATVLWEFAEFILDRVVGTNIQVSLANTMQDQFMGILGGLTWILIYLRSDSKNSEHRPH